MWRWCTCLMVALALSITGCTGEREAAPRGSTTAVAPASAVPTELRSIGDDVTEVVALFKAQARQRRAGMDEEAALSGERAGRACEGLLARLSDLEGFDSDPHLAGIAIGCTQPYLDTVTGDDADTAENIRTSWDRYLLSTGDG